jgi:hypothetical protein
MPIKGRRVGALVIAEGERMARQELETGLYELGSQIWEAIQSDDAIADTLFKLVDMKLILDNVTLNDLCLDRDAAEAILTGVEDDATNLLRPKKFVPPSEWAKLALYNLAMDWVLDQALVRMKLESKWPFQQNVELPKP